MVGLDRPSLIVLLAVCGFWGAVKLIFLNFFAFEWIIVTCVWKAEDVFKFVARTVFSNACGADCVLHLFKRRWVSRKQLGWSSRIFDAKYRNFVFKVPRMSLLCLSLRVFLDDLWSEWSHPMILQPSNAGCRNVLHFTMIDVLHFTMIGPFSSLTANSLDLWSNNGQVFICRSFSPRLLFAFCRFIHRISEEHGLSDPYIVGELRILCTYRQT